MQLIFGNILFQQEPAFQELILLYTEEMDEIEAMDKSEIPSLQLKIYETIPIPELPVIYLFHSSSSD